MPPTPTVPLSPTVIVTRHEIDRLFHRQGVAAGIHEAAREDGPAAFAAAVAMTAAIQHELEKAEEDAETGRVILAPGHAPTSVLQSLIATGEGGRLHLAPLENGGAEATFDTGDWDAWARRVWDRIQGRAVHPLPLPASPAPQALPGQARIALVGDWGTGGLYGGPRIAESLANDPDPFALLVHLGDVYYSGSEAEVAEFLGRWPRPAGAQQRAINGNHEMYSGGHAYFDRLLPAFGQEASCFAHQNAHFTIVGLDVAHLDHQIDDAQVGWLEAVLRQAGERKVLLLSHHHLFSTFESQGDKLRHHPRFGAILASRRIFAWYWGHEHRCVIYQEPDPGSGLWGRCLGHGGMPQPRRKTRGLPPAPGPELADWRLAPARRDDEGRVLAPPAMILEGPNELVPVDRDRYLPNGYAVLTLDGPRLFEEVRDPFGRVVYRNQLA